MSERGQQTLFEWREFEVANQAHELCIRLGFAVLAVVINFVLELHNENICSGLHEQ